SANLPEWVSHAERSPVLELRSPVLAASLGRTVEQRPHGPHEVDVPAILASLWLGEPQLARPEVMDIPSAADEYVRQGPLLSRLVFGAVIAVEGVALRGEQHGVAPPSPIRMLTELRDRRLGDDGEVHALDDVPRRAVDGVDDRCTRRARRH